MKTSVGSSEVKGEGSPRPRIYFEVLRDNRVSGHGRIRYRPDGEHCRRTRSNLSRVGHNLPQQLVPG